MTKSDNQFIRQVRLLQPLLLGVAILLFIWGTALFSYLEIKVKKETLTNLEATLDTIEKIKPRDAEEKYLSGLASLYVKQSVVMFKATRRNAFNPFSTAVLIALIYIINRRFLIIADRIEKR